MSNFEKRASKLDLKMHVVYMIITKPFNVYKVCVHIFKYINYLGAVIYFTNIKWGLCIYTLSNQISCFIA